MKPDLNSFDREKAIDETLAAEAVALDLSNARVKEPLRVVGRAIKTAAGVEIKGQLTGSIQVDCDRCLEPVERPLDVEFDLEFAPKQQLESGANLELHADDMKLDAIAGSDLDLAEIAREQVLLDLPQQFFCKDECKGLCEKCGTNLNLKDCDCENEEIDPRWAALKDLN
jgi:uncharacterized protein